MSDPITNTIRESVASTIASSSKQVQDDLINVLAKEELASRTQALRDGYEKIAKLRQDLQKIDRPDNVQFDRSGKQVDGGTFSKERAQEIKKLEEEIGKWAAALSKAWGTNPETNETITPDYVKLRELLKKG